MNERRNDAQTVESVRVDRGHNDCVQRCSFHLQGGDRMTEYLFPRYITSETADSIFHMRESMSLRPRMTELKPCPFCGHELHRYEENGEWVIECLTKGCLMICGPLCKKDAMERMLEVEE